MKINTHLKIDNNLNGEVVKVKKGYAKVKLTVTEVMRADEQGLVHGGFAFGAADYAAMVAVNDPFVVLAKSEVKFLAPIRVGAVVHFEAQITQSMGYKHVVEVTGAIVEKKVFTGIFYTAVLTKHVFNL